MKPKRFSVEQIVAVLKQMELGMPVADVTRQMGISEQTFYRWKKQYTGLQSDQVRELKKLRDENARLKRVVAEPDQRAGERPASHHGRYGASARNVLPHGASVLAEPAVRIRHPGCESGAAREARAKDPRLPASRRMM